MTALPAITLTLEHLHAYAAWLAHGPGTARAVSGKSDIPLIELRPRTDELRAVGGVRVEGQSVEGPIYSAVTRDVNASSPTDAAERQLNSLPVRDQVSLAAGIMAKYGKRNKHTGCGGRDQPEFF